MGATHLYFDVDYRGKTSGASICRRGRRMTEKDGWTRWRKRSRNITQERGLNDEVPRSHGLRVTSS